MRKLVLVLLALVNVEAFASKARVGSLLGADHIVDVQTTFTVPSHVLLLNPFLTYEMGTVGTGAEAGLMRKMGGGNILFYVGHQNVTSSMNGAMTDLRTGNSYIEQTNPVEILYGTGNMGFGASISHLDSKANGTKETTVVGKWGMNMGNDSWAWAHVHLWSQAEKTTAGVTDKFTASPWASGGLSMAMNTMRFFGRIDLGKAKNDAGAAAGTDTDITDTNISVGLEDRSLKTNAADIYYGVRFDFAKRAVESKSAQDYRLPVFIGIEAPVFSWLTARASAQQNVLIGQTKNETTTPTTEGGITANTQVAAGLGFSHAGFTLDGSLTAATDGNINGNQFLSQAALTYNF